MQNSSSRKAGKILLVILAIALAIGFYLTVFLLWGPDQPTPQKKPAPVENKVVQPEESNRIICSDGNYYKYEVEITKITFAKAKKRTTVRMYFDMTSQDEVMRNIILPWGFLKSNYFTPETGVPYDAVVYKAYTARPEVLGEHGEPREKIADYINGSYQMSFTPKQTRKFIFEFSYLEPHPILEVQFWGFDPIYKKDEAWMSAIRIESPSGKIISKGAIKL